MASPDSRQEIQRDILRLLRNNGNKTFRPKEIARELSYRDNKTYRLFCDVLDEMEQEGAVSKVKGGRFGFRKRPARVEGVLRVNPQGFGFVVAEGFEEDLYVRESNMGAALDGDLVEVGLSAPARGERRREAEVLRVVERRRTQVVGTFRKVGHFAYVVPDDKRITQDIFVPEAAYNGAADGLKVLVSIDKFEDRAASPEGRVLQIFGSADDPAVRVLSLAVSMDIRAGFPDEVVAEADSIPEAIPAEEIRRRVDLRSERIFTIDPVDANDFDDAVHIKRLPNGNLELGVHIADVSAYVSPDGPIDREAFLRGTSVYLVDRVIPMLPEKLSNRVCSLRPDEDKLTYSCTMEVTVRGKVVGYRIEETVIRSKYRFTYEEAQEVIDGKHPAHPFASDLEAAQNLARTLTAKRMREGAIDFDLPEVKVELDEAGVPIRLYRKDRKASNRLIEEFMLLANRTVTEVVTKGRHSPPFVFRIHDKPDMEKITRLAEYVRAFGYRLEHRGGIVESKGLNALLERIKDEPEAPVIEQAALRSMAKAKYSTRNIGHYGLAFANYTHFTSPIRRYPDLMVHRLLKRYLAGGSPVEAEKLESRCEHCSGKEKAATDAERESIRLKQVEYIANHLGETFDGVVSGVTKFGIYVELNEVLVEGMVHVRDMDDDFYEYDDRTYRLMGRYTGKTYRLGDTVEVVVVGANVDTRQVDLLFKD